MALLMGVCLIRSSQVLASFRRTHVLKLSLPCELHRCFFLVIQLTASHSSSCCNRKGLQGQKFFKFLSPRGIAMTPKKEWQMDSSSSVHCKPLLCHRQESSWKRSRLQMRSRIVIMCFISWSDESVLPKQMLHDGGRKRARSQTSRQFWSLAAWERLSFVSEHLQPVINLEAGCTHNALIRWRNHFDLSGLSDRSFYHSSLSLFR